MGEAAVSVGYVSPRMDALSVIISASPSGNHTDLIFNCVPDDG
jgi:hypothetical protein